MDVREQDVTYIAQSKRLVRANLATNIHILWIAGCGRQKEERRHSEMTACVPYLENMCQNLEQYVYA